LIGSKGPASAVAAKVVATTGSRRQVFVNQWATSYLCNNDPRIHIGLGNEGIINTLEIFWTGGKKEVYRNVAADRYITIKEGKGITEESD